MEDDTLRHWGAGLDEAEDIVVNRVGRVVVILAIALEEAPARGIKRDAWRPQRLKAILTDQWMLQNERNQIED